MRKKNYIFYLLTILISIATSPKITAQIKNSNKNSLRENDRFVSSEKADVNKYFLIENSESNLQNYTTPGTGVNWSLDDLVTNSPETVSFQNGEYIVHQDFTVAINDTLNFISGNILKLEGGVKIAIGGVLNSIGTEEEMVIIDAIDDSNPYNGFNFENGSFINIKYSSIQNGGGLRVLTPNFILTNSYLAHNVKGQINTGATVSLYRGKPLIEGMCFLKMN